MHVVCTLCCKQHIPAQHAPCNCTKSCQALHLTALHPAPGGGAFRAISMERGSGTRPAPLQVRGRSNQLQQLLQDPAAGAGL